MLKRKYVYSDITLITFIKSIINGIKKNISDFAEYNIDITQMDELIIIVKEFEILSDDSEYLYSAVIESETKDELKSSLISKLKDLLLRVEFKYGKDSPQVKNFEVSKRYLFSEEELLSVCRRAYLLLNEMISELADVGLTSEKLADFNDLVNLFEEARSTKTKAYTERSEKTKERIIMANMLYDKAMAYSAIAKSIYKSKNPSKYKRFMPPKRSPKGLDEPPILSFDAETKLISWSKIDEATSYQLQNSEKGKFKEIYSGEATSYKLSGAKGRFYVRVRARNSKGFGPFSEELDIIV